MESYGLGKPRSPNTVESRFRLTLNHEVECLSIELPESGASRTRTCFCCMVVMSSIQMPPADELELDLDRPSPENDPNVQERPCKVVLCGTTVLLKGQQSHGRPTGESHPRKEISEPGCDSLGGADICRALKAGNALPPPRAWMKLLLHLAAAWVTEGRCQVVRALVLVVASLVPLDNSVEVEMSKRRSIVAARMRLSARSSHHGIDGLVLLRPNSMSLDEFDVTQSPPSQCPNTIL